MSSNAFKRSIKACNRCRKRRTKCMGEPPHPCKACREGGHLCVYSESDKRVTVPESYSLELQSRVERVSNVQDDRDDATVAASVARPSIESGFTSTNNWVLGQSGQYHYIGNSSSTYIANRLNPTTETSDWRMYPQYEDTSWSERSSSPEIPLLPPLEVAKRLYQAQRAYIGTIFSFLSDTAFHERLERVYAREPNPDNGEDCLVYCQISSVLGFGQMYSINQWIGSEGPPGFTYFTHALKFSPHVFEGGSLLSIEVSAYVAYFMQTINRRDSAYTYIGIALRMAISLGSHQEVSDQDIDVEAREHRRRLWWSTYSMERLLCVTSGHPIAIQDEDIDLLPPCAVRPEDGYAASVLTIYTELSRIQGMIGEKIYRKKQRSGPESSACIQHIMQKLNELFERLPETSRLNHSELDQMPKREVVSMHSHFYHCINMTARPILMHTAQQRFAANAQRSKDVGWESGFSPEITNVIDAAISAARSSALLLSTAARYNLVATYGFLDGEQAFSAALSLVMVNIAFPYKESNASAMEMALGVLQTMADRGNRYMRACHSLLTKIKHSARASAVVDTSLGGGRTQQNDQERTETAPAEPARVAGVPLEPSQTYSLDFDCDPGLWATSSDSIDIDMDRQWIESLYQGTSS